MTVTNKAFNKAKSPSGDRQRKHFNSLLSKLSKVLDWLISQFVITEKSSVLTKELGSFTERVRKILINRGPIETLNYVKEVRRTLSCYLSGNKNAHPKVKCTKDGIPAILGDLIPLIRRTPSEVIPLVYTILTSTRSLSFGSLADTKSITDAGTHDFSCVTSNPLFSKYLSDFWSELGFRPSKTRVPKRCQWSSYHLTSKSGPNGHALLNSLSDLYSLPSELIESIKQVGGKVLAGHIDYLLSIKSQLGGLSFPTKEGKYRKIVSFPDKELKVRVVAILDYWSQTVLKPLHHYLNEVLKRIPQDCTYDQGSFWNKIDKSEVFYSLDLTAATDRFPMDFIKLVLKAKFPFDYVDHWSNIMVGFPFDYRQDTLRYSVGNPMGAYSSWSSFAIAHHFVVYYCIRELKLKWSDVPYCLLGDDIVIGHKEVATKYINLIQSLGVEVNASKTFISTHFCEFAKRLIYKGQEITPFPISALKESENRSYLLSFLIQDCEKKGWKPINGTPSAVQAYYRNVLRYNARRGAVCKRISTLSLFVNSLTKDTEKANERLAALIRLIGCPMPSRTFNPEGKISKIIANQILSKTILDAHQRASFQFASKYNNRKTSFGLSVTKFIKELESRKILEPLVLDHLTTSSFPMIDNYLSILRKFDLVRSELLLRTPSQATWKELLSLVLLPVDDEVFTRRLHHRHASACTTIGRILEKAILNCEEELLTYPKYQLPGSSTKPKS